MPKYSSDSECACIWCGIMWIYKNDTGGKLPSNETQHITSFEWLHNSILNDHISLDFLVIFVQKFLFGWNVWIRDASNFLFGNALPAHGLYGFHVFFLDLLRVLSLLISIFSPKSNHFFSQFSLLCFKYFLVNFFSEIPFLLNARID